MLTPQEFDGRFDKALGFDHIAGAQSKDELARLEAYRRERPPWEASPDLRAISQGAFRKVVFRGDWSAAFARVSEVLADQIGADLVTLAGGHAVQHREGFNRHLKGIWETPI